MKGLILFACIVLLAGVSEIVAQADCGYRVLVDVRNEANIAITSAKLRLLGRDWYYRPQFGKYETSGLQGVGHRFTGDLKISARGYKPFTGPLTVSCSYDEYLVIIRPRRSVLEAEFKVISKSK